MPHPGKKIKGRKRQAFKESEGNLVHALIHTADIPDCDGVPMLLAAISNRFQRLRQVFANGGCAGDELKQALDGIDK